MSYLMDTNILSEVRKGRRGNKGVLEWHNTIDSANLWTSVIVVAEIREGIERLRPRDPVTANHLETWISRIISNYEDRILPITLDIAQRWGRMSADRPLPKLDAFLAATALEHQLTIVTRNERHIKKHGVSVLNPFS